VATIRKRLKQNGSEVWEVQIRIRGFDTRTGSFKRKSDARQWAALEEAALRERRRFPHREAEKHTLKELVEDYQVHGKAEYKRALDWWVARLGTQRLIDIGPEVIGEAKQALSAGTDRKGSPRAPATVNRYLAALSVAYTHGRRELKWVRDNPVRDVKRLEEPGGRTRFLAPKEREALLEACTVNQDLHDLVMLALMTGARAGELISLRWPDVKLDKARAVARDTKNGDTRMLPLAGPALEILRRRERVRRIDSDLVFPHDFKRAHTWYSEPFRAAVKAAGIENFRFHDLRHTAATYLLESGATLAELAGILGHKTLAMVKRYSHVSDEHASTVVERMTTKVFGDLKLAKGLVSIETTGRSSGP
jgi:integrase